MKIGCNKRKEDVSRQKECELKANSKSAATGEILLMKTFMNTWAVLTTVKNRVMDRFSSKLVNRNVFLRLVWEEALSLAKLIGKLLYIYCIVYIIVWYLFLKLN